MKIKIEKTVDIDPGLWASEYGIKRGDVRKDVQEYYGGILTRLADTFNNTGTHQI